MLLSLIVLCVVSAAPWVVDAAAEKRREADRARRDQQSGCTSNGTHYEVGKWFPAGDDCNFCFCSRGVPKCTTAECPPCEFQGEMYNIGESYSPDDCNHCVCSYYGRARCYQTGCSGPENRHIDTNERKRAIPAFQPGGCGADTCDNGGRCLEGSRGAAGRHVCMCLDGFTGGHCEIQEASPCGSSPCANGARCLEGWGAMRGRYFCECPAGFTGINCERTEGVVHHAVSRRASEGPCPARSWPELAGVPFDLARLTILQYCPKAIIIAKRPGTPWPMVDDRWNNLVRVSLDEEDRVMSPPAIDPRM